jgi:tetratricopeptide (TPR) repeat protein
LSVVAAGQTIDPPGIAVRSIAAHRLASYDELRERGSSAAYNLDYEGARRDFEEMIRMQPENPVGPLYLATNVWLKSLNDARRLQSSLYNSDEFYVESEEKVDSRVQEQFRALTRRAKTLAEERLKRDPRDVEALYLLGSIDGVKAAFSAAVERNFMSALRDGQRSVERHREVLKLDPQYKDAEMTVGLYDYVVGDLPLAVKVLASLGGVRGSKKRGLATLERVAREGHWSRDHAKVVLIALFKREGRFAEAGAVANEMAAAYPRNYLFRLEAADALVSLAAQQRSAGNAAAKTERDAFATFETLLRDPAVRRIAPSLDLIHYRYGEALLAADRPDLAAAQFRQSAAAAKAQEGMQTLAHLRAAQSLDLAGKRDEALAHYRIAAARPNIYDSHAAAEKGLREPYRK